MQMSKFLLMTDAMGQGGAERQLACLAEMLKKTGYQVRLVTFYNHDNFYAPQLDKAGISVEVFQEGQSSKKRPFVIQKIIKGWKPDMVVAYKPGTAMAACIARMICKFNLVVSERNTTQELTLSERLRFFLYKWADHIVPNSQSQADFIRVNYPNLYTKVKVITNMVDTDIFIPKENPIKNDIPQVVTTARITPQKNVLNYIEAIAELRRRNVKVHFNWYGRIDGGDDYWQKIQDSIRLNKVEENITFHGPTQNTVAAYQSADLFFLPSEYEGFPNVLCEAMACGIPSIATDVCDNKNILTDSRWLCDFRSPIDMADKIENMLCQSQEVRNQIGQENRNTVLNICSPEKFVNKYISLL